MSREKQFTERISTFLTKEQFEQLQAKAEALGMTVSSYIRLLIILDLKK